MNDLTGKTILLTRAAEDMESWADVIRSRGGRVVELPCIACEPLRDAGTATALKNALRDADWLVLTSRRGAAAVAELHPVPLPPQVQVAVVGPATAEEAGRLLGRCDLVSASGTGLGLATELGARLRVGTASRARVVIAAAEKGRRFLEDVLEPLGVSVSRIPVYRTVPSPAASPKRDLSAHNIDAVLLASPSAARGLDNVAHVPAGVKVFTIGPTTTEAARSLGLNVAAQAGSPTLEALLEVIQ